MDGEVTDRQHGAGFEGERRRFCGLMLLFLVVAAGCGTSPAEHREEFRAADSDHDEFVSRVEFDQAYQKYDEKRRAKEFEKADADHDQKLTLIEFTNADFGRHPVYWALGIFSVVSFVGSLVAIPVVVARLPVNHFVAPHEAADWVSSDVRRRLWLVLKNLLGIVLVVGGVIMLILPGQGVLTILLGVALTDFPGKWRLMRALAHRPNVMKALNWMRQRAHQPPLLAPPPYHDASAAG